MPGVVHAGVADETFPLPWSVYRWIDGDPVMPGTVSGWGAFGSDLAGSAAALHDSPLGGARRADGLDGYRGGSLHALAEGLPPLLEQCRRIEGLDLDVDALGRLWHESLAVPEPPVEHVWLHGDLKPTNLLVRATGAWSRSSTSAA